MGAPGDSTDRVRSLDRRTEHALRNHLAVIVGFCELLLSGMPTDDPRALDVSEIHKAATAAMQLLNANSQ
jgi:hypothetical protein